MGVAAPITQKGNAMVSQFVAAPIAWALRVETQSDIPALAKPPEYYPIAGWLCEDGTVISVVSYQGQLRLQGEVLEDLRIDLIVAADRMGIRASGNLAYTLVPV